MQGGVVETTAERARLTADAAASAAAYSPYDGSLKGARHAALSAPGCSGTRPEHITDLLKVPRRADSNRLLRSLAKVFAAVDAQALPDEARWMTRTRLCWQRKKNGNPRPIKMGEFLRWACATRVVYRGRSKLRAKTLAMHQ